MLELDGLTTRYGAITVIRDLGLRVDEGEVVALIGPNGAGKTTTLASIAGLLTPAEGSVRLDGEDVTGTAPDEMLRRGAARPRAPADLRRPDRGREPAGRRGDPRRG